MVNPDPVPLLSDLNKSNSGLSVGDVTDAGLLDPQYLLIMYRTHSKEIRHFK